MWHEINVHLYATKDRELNVIKLKGKIKCLWRVPTLSYYSGRTHNERTICGFCYLSSRLGIFTFILFLIGKMMNRKEKMQWYEDTCFILSLFRTKFYSYIHEKLGKTSDNTLNIVPPKHLLVLSLHLSGVSLVLWQTIYSSEWFCLPHYYFKWIIHSSLSIWKHWCRVGQTKNSKEAAF